jgi:hypothetical protein
MPAFPEGRIIHCLLDLFHHILKDLVGRGEGDASLDLNLKGRQPPIPILSVNDDVIEGIAFLPTLQSNAVDLAIRQTTGIHFEQHGQQIGSTDLRLEQRARTASGSRTRHSLHTSMSPSN